MLLSSCCTHAWDQTSPPKPTISSLKPHALQHLLLFFLVGSYLPVGPTRWPLFPSLPPSLPLSFPSPLPPIAIPDSFTMLHTSAQG
jgi:hypothetical protein